MAQLRHTRKIEELVEQLPLPPLDTLPQCQAFCDILGRELAGDVRMQVWNITAVGAKPFQVRGYVSHPCMLEGLKWASAHFGNPCDTAMVEILPINSAYQLTLAQINQAMTTLYELPCQSNSLDLMYYGDYAFVLREESLFFLVMSSKGFIGWTHYRVLTPIRYEAWQKLVNSPKTHIIKETQYRCHQLSAGTLVNHIPEIEIGHRDKQVTFSRDTEREKRLCETALSFLNTPYVWGGNIALGIDCSGFTSLLYQRLGIVLPRDADQQFRMGRITALPGMTGAMRPGDLLFFSGPHGCITHVGMALNDDEFIHALGGHGVITTRLSEDAKLSHRFICAKRLLL